MVDDGSADSTVKVAEQSLDGFPRSQIVSLHTNQGRGAARLEGQKRAKGEYLAFVDSDVELPPNWVERALHAMEDYQMDAVSGVAIPDGDCVVIARIGNLLPKIRGGSASLTGNNLMIKKNAITEVPFQNLPYGDDIRLAWDLDLRGYKTMSIKDLVIKHSESKSFKRTVVWQYQQGKEATSLLWDYKKVRTPDIAWLGTVMTPILPLIIFRKDSFLMIIGVSEFIYCMLVSVAFLFSRFNLKVYHVRTFVAIGVNFLFMGSYFLGRFRGLPSIRKRKEE